MEEIVKKSKISCSNTFTCWGKCFQQKLQSPVNQSSTQRGRVGYYGWRNVTGCGRAWTRLAGWLLYDMTLDGCITVKILTWNNSVQMWKRLCVWVGGGGWGGITPVHPVFPVLTTVVSPSVFRFTLIETDHIKTSHK